MVTQSSSEHRQECLCYSERRRSRPPNDPRAGRENLRNYGVLFWLAVADPSNEDLKFMRRALDEAAEAGRRGEVPIGTVVAVNGEVIATGSNRTITDCDPTAHAEMVALRAAARAIGNYRLTNATLYVTIEPCAMCAGAMIQARIARLVYGANDPKGGAVTSCFSVLDHPQLNHRVEVTSGVMADEAAELLREFFAARR